MIDVECFETKVLKGLTKPIPILSFEFLSTMQKSRVTCLKHLNSLGNYEYNWSEGDSYRLELENWVDANVLLESIRRNGNQFFSGDIYGRLVT